VLANGARPDVKRAGFGQGRCGFSLKLPAPLPAFQRHEISVRPAGGSAALTGSPVVIDPGFLHDLVDAGGLARMVDAAIKSAAAPDEIAGLEADLELAAGAAPCSDDRRALADPDARCRVRRHSQPRAGIFGDGL
jgi:hypothetical protein